MPHPPNSPTSTPSNSIAQSSLLPAMSVESLPHYTMPSAAEDILEDPTTAHPDRPGMSEAMNAMSQLSSMPSRTAHMGLGAISPAGLKDERGEQHRPPPLRLQTSADAPREDERVDSPSPMMSIEMSNGRRKLSLSSPRDRIDFSPLLNRRPVTGYNRAANFHGPVPRENSGCANPAVEAAHERWRRADTDDTPFSPFSPIDAPLTAKPRFTKQDDDHGSELVTEGSSAKPEGPQKPPTQTKITEFFPSTAASASAAHEHLAKQENDFEDRELQRSQQDWRECDCLRWTKNSSIELVDRGILDSRGSPKPSVDYYLRLGSAARNMNKAISPIVDAGGFEEDMSTAWLMTSPLSAHGTPGSAEFRKEGKEYFGVSTHATPRSGTPRSGRKERRSKEEEEDELALVNVSPIEPNPAQEEGEGDERLLKWNGEIISRLGKGVAQEIRTDTPPPPVQLVQLPPQGMRSAAEERRYRRRMERKQSGSAASTPAPSTELMQQEWIKTGSPKA